MPSTSAAGAREAAPAIAPMSDEAAALVLGLRVACASVLCLLAGAWFHIEGADVSALLVQLILARAPFQAVQQGVELLLGLVLAIACGILLNLCFAAAAPQFLTVMTLLFLAFTYGRATKWLPFLFLIACIFIGHMAYTGLTAPGETFAAAGQLLGQGAVGVGVSLLVHGLSGGDLSLVLRHTGDPLWPPRAAWVEQSLRLTVVSMLALFATTWLVLPVTQTMTSALILASFADDSDRRRKEWERAIAVVMGGAYALTAMAVLALQPYLSLLAALLFLGNFAAAYRTRADVPRTYLFQQSGMVVAMTLVVPVEDLGHLTPAMGRLAGVIVGALIAEAIAQVWPA